jgi:adenylate kinase family enzyme
MLVLVTGLPGTGKSTLAALAADALGAAVIAHDWATSGLRPYPALQAARDDMEGGRRLVGWLAGWLVHPRRPCQGAAGKEPLRCAGRGGPSRATSAVRLAGR